MKITCGIYLYNTLTEKILICHATKSKNGWSIPKGVREDNEMFFQAAAREMLEETNVDIEKIKILERHDMPPIYYVKQNKVLQSFLIITDSDFKDVVLKCNSLVEKGGYPEIDKILWVSIKDMMNMVHISQVENVPLIEKHIERHMEEKQQTGLS